MNSNNSNKRAADAPRSRNVSPHPEGSASDSPAGSGPGSCWIENLGCAKNQVDAEVMLSALQTESGWTVAEGPEDADLIIINTCGFIEPAREESLETLFSFRAEYPQKKILLAGCLAQRYGKEIGSELIEADGLFGNLDLRQVTRAASQVMQGIRTELYPELPAKEYYARETLLSFPGSAYLKLSEGCSHHCTYCAIPLIRGDLRSRPFDEILADARSLIASGVREINLIAQDLAAWGTGPHRGGAISQPFTPEFSRGDGPVDLRVDGLSGDPAGGQRFCELLAALSDLPGDHMIRMLYIHPDNFPAELPALVRDRSNILPYFDIPFQHAAEPILRAMGRQGSALRHLELISSIRETLPDAVIRSTFMLGFPGERKTHVEQLLQFTEAAELDWAGTFIYSPEEGTPAGRMRSEQAHRRAARAAEENRRTLEALQQTITERRLERWVGRVLPVLIEERIAGEDLLLGRIFAQAPEVDGSTVVMSAAGKPGELITCGIRRRVGIDLEAIPVCREPESR